ncbi:unnamed protein product [Amoebophrya sp. A120]|nr:unnamed protein product [Amoebophrya sp. A120]|eukprot:GSA120T00006659001.1
MPAGSYYTNRSHRRSPAALKRTRECCANLYGIIRVACQLFYTFICRRRDYDSLKDLEFGSVLNSNEMSGGAGAPPPPFGKPTLYQPRNLQAGFVPLHSFSSTSGGTSRGAAAQQVRQRAGATGMGTTTTTPAGGVVPLSNYMTRDQASELVGGSSSRSGTAATRTSSSSVAGGAGQHQYSAPATLLQAANPENRPVDSSVNASQLPRSFARRQQHAPKPPAHAPPSSLIPQPVGKINPPMIASPTGPVGAPTAAMIPGQGRKINFIQ